MATEIEQVRELLAFFEIQYDKSNGTKEVTPLVTLSDDEEAAWAKAFATRTSFICPDAKGRWGSLPKASLDKGTRRADGKLIAKYVKHVGLTPADFAGLPENYFGRIGDKAA